MEKELTPEQIKQLKKAKLILWLGLFTIVFIGLITAVYFVFLKQAGTNTNTNINSKVNTNKTLNTNSAGVPIDDIFSNKIVYGIGLDSTLIPKLQADCQERGGAFSECGSPCGPEAEYCITVCAYTCELGSNTNTVPADEQTCLSRGGKWGPIGMGQTKRCNLPTADGGKTCTDGSQCGAGICKLGAIDDSQLNKNIPLSGTCPAWSINVGCLGQLVEEGKAVTGPCFD
ncbi:MAG: hypothetical protein WCV50_03070 [Patescibacteria group bacterium]|jgi:hypothetical protein